MKTIFRVLTIGLFLLVADSARAVVGYINYPFYTGNNFFQNNLSQPGNLLSQVMKPATTPGGTTVSLWDPLTQTFGPSSLWNGTEWSIDFALPPGTGAQLTAPAAFTNTFVGEVVTRDGSSFDGPPYAYPLPFSGPNGVYLLGDKLPIAGADVFMRVIGREAQDGEQIIYDDGTVYTFSSGQWSNGVTTAVPTLAPCEAALFNIGPVDLIYVVPEPSTAALGLLGLTLMAFRRKA